MTKRILIVKFWALGDILMATPILRALKNAYPDSHICWLVDQAYAGALEGNEYLDVVLPFDSGTWRRDYRYGRWRQYLATSISLNRRLRAMNFDIVISLTAEKWWVVWFLCAVKKVGLFPFEKAGLLGRLYNYAVTRSPLGSRHNTDHYLEVLPALGIRGDFDRRMTYSPTRQRCDDVDYFLARQQEYDPLKPLLVMHPGTSQPSKCWPVSSYAQLANLLTSRFTVVITGSSEEASLANHIKAASINGGKLIVAAGVLTELGHTGSLVDRATAVVTGDTSVLHMASALNTPFAAIYGSSRPGDNAPLFGTYDLLYDDTVPCAPCNQFTCPLKGDDHLRCQTVITPDTVFSSVMKLVETGKQQ